MIGVDRVAQPEAVGQEGGAEQHRIVVEGDQRPAPGRHIDGDQQPIDADDPAAQIGGAVIEEVRQQLPTSGLRASGLRWTLGWLRHGCPGAEHHAAVRSFIGIHPTHRKRRGQARRPRRARAAGTGSPAGSGGAARARSGMADGDAGGRAPAHRGLTSTSVGTSTTRPWRTPRSAITCSANLLHLLGLAAQDRHLHAAVVVEVRVHRGQRQVRGGRGRCRRAASTAAAPCGRRRRPAPPRNRAAGRGSRPPRRMPARARSRIASERFW